MHLNENRPGTVYLVGAGPGDPGLLTRRGAELLGQADAVAYDALVDPRLLDEVRPGARRLFIGRRKGIPGPGQDRVNRLLVALARRHGTVVRLKGGDPFVFGRGGEEALALARAGVPVEVVPGVTAALGVAASALLPLTHRGAASSVTFLTGHRAGEGLAGVAPLYRVPKVDTEGTLVIFMGLARIRALSRELVARGHAADTPVAVVEKGTLPEERIVEGTLDDIAAKVRLARLEGPALIVVGPVVEVGARIRALRARRVGDRDTGATERLPGAHEPEAARVAGGRP